METEQRTELEYGRRYRVIFPGEKMQVCTLHASPWGIGAEDGFWTDDRGLFVEWKGNAIAWAPAEYFHYGSMTMVELVLPWDCVRDCHHQGACDQDVEFWEPLIDWSNVDLENLRFELNEFGAWDADELQDDHQNRRRWIWSAAADIQENDPDWIVELGE